MGHRSGGSQLDGCGCGSFTKLHSRGQPGLGKTSSKLTYALVGRIPFLTGCFNKTSVSCLIKKALHGIPEQPHTVSAGFPRVTMTASQRRGEREPKWKWQSVMI